ncbi:MAG: cyclase family protein [Candidatus Dormibacteraceae bacterium]
MTEAEVLHLFEECSNQGRWGAGDELGTLNYVTPAKTLAAWQTVDAGIAVSLGKDLKVRGSAQSPPSAVLVIADPARDPNAALDTLTVTQHGFETTHVDAVGHSYFRGGQYNGRKAAANVGPHGIEHGSILAMANGVVTRGIFLDVAASRGVDRLEPGEGISVTDLEVAEGLGGVRVGEGDAIFVRSGLELQGGHSPEVRTGVLPDVVRWVHERRVAIYSGDCIERMPSGYSAVPMPLHQVGLVAMGLCMLDSTDMERLAAACREHGRNEFALIVAPLRIPGGTGSPVNPIALF